LQSGLFANLTSFDQLEARISQQPTTKDIGDAFEVFAEAYLATQKNVLAKEVWPHNAVPEILKLKYSLPGQDMGVDGLIETSLGQHKAYQVKFRSNRPPLTWEELSTFFGLTDGIWERVLFTNSNSYPSVINDRSGFFCIRGSDLDRLEGRDFEVIAKWLEGEVAEVKRKAPRPHQEEAIKDIIVALEKNDRATAVMACGTGKTLVALWIAEKLKFRNILVIVPSLALVRQILHDWIEETSWEKDKLSYLCVCSDPTVTEGVDDIIVRQSDLDFPVSTDVESARKFLKHGFDGTKIVFSTYHSAHIVADAMAPGTAFDFAVFDEAHKTAGRVGTRFNFALKDENLFIKKRLFLTATPRHYDIRDKDQEGEAKLVYSMDVPEVYGEKAHSLSFSKAARLGIICEYKVVISVVISKMVNNQLLINGEVIVNGNLVNARHVATQIALKEAVRKYKVTSVFTFHSSVKSAQLFTSQGSEGINHYLEDFGAFHVNGKMNTSDRDQAMKGFAQSKKAIMSNARCLTEGVDVPAVDMVCFMSPRKNKVDIVQAVGRALRKSKGKTIGYVLVPLFLEMENQERLEDAVVRTGFDDIWDILQALKEQDDVLVDIIREISEEKGRTNNFSDDLLREKIEMLGHSVSLEFLRKAITSSCVEKLGTSWDIRLGELQEFNARTGDFDVPLQSPVYPYLGSWVRTQRQNKDRLTPERRNRLEELGFDWEPHAKAWEDKFAELQEFKEQEGHCNVPSTYPYPSLKVWVATQRSRQDRLTPERRKRLEELGFAWGTRSKGAWEDKFTELQAFKEENGHCAVPKRYPPNPSLGSWIVYQRQFKGRLTPERRDRLEKLGFIWDRVSLSWEKKFAKLVEFKEQEGHCNVPKPFPPNPSLRRWVEFQRQYKDELTPEQRDRLEKLGFDWYHLTPEQRKLQEEQKFIWYPSEVVSTTLAWEAKFAELQDFGEREGHCAVPEEYLPNPSLGLWVVKQRVRKDLTPEQRDRLEKLGFDWRVPPTKGER
jgi:superfamily II DNA or RNA helicase